VSPIDGVANRLRVSSANTPPFCSRAQLVVGTENKITAFEVVASPSEILDVNEVLSQADQFVFSSGKDPQSQKPYFDAQTRDQKILIHFIGQGRQMTLSRVDYFY
jgi:hypothetical protein